MKFTDDCLTYYYTPKSLLLQWFNGTVTLKGKLKYGSIFMVNNMIFKTAAAEKIRALFKDYTDTLVWSCLDGTMGELYTDSDRESASAVIGDFHFLAGRLCAELVRLVEREYTILVPQNEGWSELIKEIWGSKARKITRHATRKDVPFDIDRLKSAELPAGFEVEPIDRKWFDYCTQTPWCRDFVSQYETYEKYEKLGIGVLVLKDGIPVSGASSYSSYKGGIEIQVDTLTGHRRQGLAYCACSQLILKCLEKGIYPSWDAHGLTSLALAEKLGYRYSHSYTAFEVFK